MVTTSGIINTIAGTGYPYFNGDGGPATAAAIHYPSGVEVDPTGYVFIADYFNNRIRKLTPVGLGINSLSDHLNFTVYPNPSTGIFTIQSSVASNQWSVEVYNVLGEQVYSNSPEHSGPLANSYQLDLSSNPNGIYFYRVISENGGLVGEGKIVIER
jgi:Secretion system C-terminal sorting domain